MICTSCGVNNRDDAQFCRGCGAALGNPFQHPSATKAPSEAPSAPPTYAGYQSQFPQPPTHSSGAGGYQAPLPATASTRATAAMIVSIVSLFTCGPFMSIPGMIMGKLEMNAIAQGQAAAAGLSYAKAGFWIGLVSTVLYCGGGLLAIAFGFLGSILSALSVG